MGKLAEAFVDVRADLKGLDSGLGQARGRITSFVGSANGVLAGLGVGVGVAGIAAGLLDAAKAASDLAETTSKTKVVFKDAAGVVIGQAQALADKFGLVKQTTLDAASNIGLVTQAAGLNARASADLSNRLVKLAADASSFYNVGFDVALEKIRSALVGESEPIRAFGVLLSEDAVKAEALRMGLIRTTKEIDEQSKVMARASLIFRQMGAANGDLERTIDGAANQMRKLNGELENMKADFGASLTTPLVEAIKLAKELGATLSKATGGNGAESLGDVVAIQASADINASRLINKGWQEGSARKPGDDRPHAFAEGVFGALKAAFFPSRAQLDDLAGLKVGLKGITAPPMTNATAPPSEEETRRADAFWAARRQAADRGRADLELRLKEQREAGGGLSPFSPLNLAGLANPLGLLAASDPQAARAKLEADADAEDRAERRRERMASLSGITDSESFDRMVREQALQTDNLPEKQLKEAEKQTEALDEAVKLLGKLNETGDGKKKGAAVVRGPES